MTISYVGAGAFATGSGNLTPTIHASTAEGDLMLAALGKRGNDFQLVAPGGWTLITQHSTSPAGTMAEFSIYGKIAGASESSPTFTAAGGAQSGIAQVATFATTQSWNIGAVVDNTAETATAFTTNITAPSITPTQNNCLVIFYGKRRDTVNTTSAGALSGTTEIGQAVDESVAALAVFGVWNYVIQTVAATANPGSWTISNSGGNNTLASIAVSLIDSTATFVPDTSPLYYGATLLANKTNIEYVVNSGHTGINGEVIAVGTNATTDGSGILTIPGGLTGALNDPVTIHLYWEEGSSPVVDRSLIVKTTLVAA